MENEPPEDDTVEWDAAQDQLPTNEERGKLVRDTLQYADFFPSGPEQNCLQSIAQTLAFFEDDAVCLGVIGSSLWRVFEIIVGLGKHLTCH
jgi:hypothetical protein